MFDQAKFEPLKTLLDAAKSVAILLPQEPSSDQVGAGLGLHLSLAQAGKFSQIGCSSPIKIENADLFGVDQIRTTIGNQNLLITFDFKEENLKKVDYDVDENGQFTLLIQPQPGTPPPDVNNINYSYSGASADLVFILGVNSLEELGKLYADEKTFLDSATTVSLGTSSRPTSFATHDFSTTEASCLAEISANLLKELQVEASPDGASNLLSTIYSETKQLSSRVTADTFEAIAVLMRQGGNLPNTSPLNTSSRFGAFPPAPMSAFGGGSPFGANPFAGGGNPFMGGSPMNPPMFEDDLPPAPPAFSAPQRAINPTQRSNRPNDWKKPRVFRPNNNGGGNRPNGQRGGNLMGGGQGGGQNGGQGMVGGSSL